jgi:NAD(P)-dependent dehydrogenase (short-subunit alcohol dehydrogenase family)
MNSFEGKTALVTGAGHGIGHATALAFAAAGAKVAVLERDVASGLEVTERIRSRGGDALFVETDVADGDQVEAAIEATVKKFGGLHCASNNAARGAGFRDLVDIAPRQWDAALAVTLTGVWHCMRFEIPAMLASGGGAIVNIASVSGMRGESLQAAYSAAKGGVIALTKTAATEYAQRNIRVNAVCPGGVRTRAIEKYFRDLPGIEERTIATHAMRRLAAPEEIADVVSFLCSDRSSFVTGHVMVADGGVLVNSHFL